MLLALKLLLVLSLAAALRQDKTLHFFINSTDGSLPSGFRGFTVTRTLRDGELEKFTRWTGVCARETIVDWGDTDVALRQIWLEDSGRKLQLIYEGGTLTDCIEEGFAEGETVAACLAGLHSYDYDDEARIVVFEKDEDNEKSSTTPAELSWLLPVSELHHRCNHVRSRSRNELIMRDHRRSKRGLQEMMIAPGTKWCGPHQLASNYKELGALDSLDRCCRRHDHCHRAIPPFSSRFNLFNYMPFTLSHCGCDQRNYHTLTSAVNGNRRKRRGRRGRRELLLIPGTQWCGRGHRATKYTNLGGFGTADSCCRRHDTACPFYIPAFESRYGLFNWGISTIMHCACDERFRTCLKMAGTSSANFIGKLFFNVVQTKCFVLKPHKVCTKQSWRGKCEHHVYRKQAYLRDNVSY
ncbi:uncharacterized protein LOC107271128 isoform X3 [Cephus cinctus]|uniref:phospholipase A2 n=1 Tax=Cephus cinctus TaxID=211228 RepID=A0AAJ7RP95_CEPCN|nr:uncharacterized protein LOC107271128 isoform X3 [Cephus cinctus]